MFFLFLFFPVVVAFVFAVVVMITTFWLLARIAIWILLALVAVVNYTPLGRRLRSNGPVSRFVYRCEYEMRRQLRYVVVKVWEPYRQSWVDWAAQRRVKKRARNERIGVMRQRRERERQQEQRRREHQAMLAAKRRKS